MDREVGIDDLALTGRERVGLRDGRSELLPNISPIRDNLYQGGVLVGGAGLVLPPRFRHVVNLFGVGYFRELEPPVTSLVVDMADSHTQEMDLVDTIADFVGVLCDDGPTLVHCQAGLNRSGVVVARVLMRKYGLTSDEAIQEVRDRRSSMALCNPMFEAWLRSHDDT